MPIQREPRQRRPVHSAWRKWNPGAPIEDLNEMQFQISKNRYIFVLGRSAGYHPSFVNSWPFRTIVKLIACGHLLRGIRNPRIPYVFSAGWHEPPEGSAVKGGYLCSGGEFQTALIQSRTKDGMMKKCREAVRQHVGHNEFRVEVAFNDEGKV